MKDDIDELLERLKIEEVGELDSMRYSVTLDEAVLACIGIVPLNNEGEEDQVTTFGVVLHTSLMAIINNLENVPSDKREAPLQSAKENMIKAREIYIDMREDLAKEKTLELDEFKTAEKGRPYVTRTSVHAWAKENLKANLVGWQIKQNENGTKNEELVDVKSKREKPPLSNKSLKLTIGALTELWLTAVGAPSGIAINDGKKANASAMAKKTEALLDGMQVKKLSHNAIRQVISPCINKFNNSDGIGSSEFLSCVKDGLQQIEDESPIRR
jgi:hypothetical protein